MADDPKRRQPSEWSLQALSNQIRSYWISPREVRAEAWALGGRHRGEVLQGARLEAKAADLSFRRAILLKAVIRSQSTADRRRRKAG